MSFKKLDSGFVCGNCGRAVEPLGYTSRNHCPHCLYSLHVDIDPGDRANECKGLMMPIEVLPSAKKGYIIVHKCTRCGEIKRNKSAEDDNFDMLLKIAQVVANSKYR